MIRVMLVDDHQMVRSAMRSVLDRADDITVVAEADSGEAAIDAACGNAPHVVLMDLNMPGIGGIEATRKMIKKLPGTKVIVVSAHLEEPYPSRMLGLGAAGYIGKDSNISDVIEAIRRVHAGGRYLSGEVAGNIAARLGPQGVSSPFDQLSEREVQIMMLILQEEGLPAIAAKLNLSPRTVSTYHGRILEKLGVKNDVALTLLAVRFGLLDDISHGGLSSENAAAS